MMWCPVVAPRKPPHAPCSSQEASQPSASEPGTSTPLPAKRSKRTKAEPAAEPNKAQGKAAKAKPAPQPGVHWSCAGGQSRGSYQLRARNTLAWATNGCETGHPAAVATAC
ncbi:hypothetical protein QJQ45_000714 [Haematococcus lacustris]|nr:hypothetical protein QJQ45_000714 [Haematococcus lacustris]